MFCKTLPSVVLDQDLSVGLQFRLEIQILDLSARRLMGAESGAVAEMT